MSKSAFCDPRSPKAQFLQKKGKRNVRDVSQIKKNTLTNNLPRKSSFVMSKLAFYDFKSPSSLVLQKKEEKG